MMINVPAALKVATLDWELERFDKRFEGLSGQFQTESYPAARWRCTVTLPPMKPETSGAVEAFLIRVTDAGNRFELGRDDRPLMGVGGSGVVDGANQTGRSIMTDGWTASGLILRAGDMIQLGPNRLHMVTADVYASPGGILYDEDGEPMLTEGSGGSFSVIGDIEAQGEFSNVLIFSVETGEGGGEPILIEGEGRASIPIEPALQSSPADGQPVLTGVNAKAVFALDGGYAVTSTPGIFSGIAFSAVQDLAWSI